MRPVAYILCAFLGITILATAGCPPNSGDSDAGNNFVQCENQTSCDRLPMGQCTLNIATGHRFCTYPDDSCVSGRRWSDLDVEMSVSGTCVDPLLLDTTPPQLLTVSPKRGDQNVATAIAITAVFSEAIAPASVTPETFQVSSAAGRIDGKIVVSNETVMFQPLGRLSGDISYSVKIEARVTDLAGNALADASQWDFVTKAADWTDAELLETEQFKDVDKISVWYGGNGNAAVAWVMRDCPQFPCSLTGKPWVAFYTSGRWQLGSEVPGSTNTTKVAVTVDRQGRTTVVWGLENRTTGVFAAQFQPGTGWTKPTSFTPIDSENDFFRSSVAVDGSGDVHVAWKATEKLPSGSRLNVLEARYNAVSGWDKPDPIESSDTDALDPSIAALTDGSIMAIWALRDGSGQFRRYTPGSGWGSFGQLPIGGNGTLGATPDNGAVFASRGKMVTASRFKSGTWSQPEITGNFSDVVSNIDIDTSDAGNTLLVWSANSGPDKKAYYSLMSPDGKLSTSLSIANLIGNSQAPRVAFDRDGRAVSVWIQSMSSDGHLWASMYDPAEGWRTPQIIDFDGTTPVLEREIFYDDRNNVFVAVWTQIPTNLANLYYNTFQ